MSKTKKTKTDINKPFKCTFCDISFENERLLKSHTMRNHVNRMDVNGRANYEVTLEDSPLKDIPVDIISIYFEEYEKYNKEKPSIGKKKVFATFYGQITYVRPFNIDTDFDIYFNKVLPWRKEHPKINNCRELCSVIFENNEEAAKLYQMMLEKNPYYRHDGKLSPFSKEFVGYKGMTDEEKTKARRKVFGSDQDDKLQNQIGYWLKRGYTQEEAKEAVHKRQQTFSLEKCIERHGEEKGREVFAERQRKWLQNYKKSNFSKVSQELFWQIYEKIKEDYNEIYFATLNPRTKCREIDSKNYETTLSLKSTTIKPDFFIKDINCIIEFDGDYWHNEDRDAERTKNILDAGYKLLNIKELAYYKDKEGSVKQCINFIRKC